MKEIQRLLENVKDKSITKIRVGPSGVYFEFLTDVAGVLDILCCGRLVILKGGVNPILAIDGSDYIDSEACNTLLQAGRVVSYEYNVERKAFMLNFEMLGQVVFRAINVEDWSILITLWSGEPYKSEEIEMIAF